MKIFKRIELTKDDLDTIERYEQLLLTICDKTEVECTNCIFSGTCDGIETLIFKNFSDEYIKISAAPEKNK